MDMSRDQAERALRGAPTGTFVIRNSSQYGHFALTVRLPSSATKDVHSTIIQSNMMPSGTSYSLQKSSRNFESFDKLVAHYSNHLDDSKQLGVKLKSEFSRIVKKIDSGHIGARVTVEGYDGEGTLLFFGNHIKTKKLRAGVRLDKPVGNNNGTVNNHKYFRCDPGHGVLCAPKKISLVNPEDAVKMKKQRELTRHSSVKAGYLRDSTKNGVKKSASTRSRSRSTSDILPAPPGGPNGRSGSAKRPLPAPPPSASMDNEPWFVGKIPGDAVKMKLQEGRDGDYVVRQSTTTDSKYIIVYNNNGTVQEHMSQYFNGSFRLTVGARTQAPTMADLIETLDECRRPAKYLCRNLTAIGSAPSGGASSTPSHSTTLTRQTSTRGPTEIPLDQTDYFVGLNSRGRIEACMEEASNGEYVVWESPTGGYTLTVINGGILHHDIVVRGKQYVFVDTGAGYESIPDIIRAVSACVSSAKGLVVDDWKPSAASAAATALSSSRSGFGGHDGEEFGGFGDLPPEDIEEEYVNTEFILSTSTRGPAPPLPPEDIEEEYVNQAVVDNVAGNFTSQASPELPPEDIEEEYVNQAMVDNIADNFASQSSPDLPPEDIEEEYVNQDAIDAVVQGTSPTLLKPVEVPEELPPETTDELYMNEGAVASAVTNAKIALVGAAEEGFGWGEETGTEVDGHGADLPPETVDADDDDWEGETYDEMESEAPPIRPPRPPELTEDEEEFEPEVYEVMDHSDPWNPS